MTNFEQYKERILKIVDTVDIRIAVCNGVLHPCEDVRCDDCDFYHSGGSCDKKFIKWLCQEYQEYPEKPKLTVRAYHFLKSLPDNVRIKNSGGRLYMDVGEFIVNTNYYDNGFIPLFPLEPDLWYEVSEILKWAVEE